MCASLWVTVCHCACFLPSTFCHCKPHSPGSTLRRGQQNYASALFSPLLWEMPVISAGPSSACSKEGLRLKHEHMSMQLGSTSAQEPTRCRNLVVVGSPVTQGHHGVQIPTSSLHCTLLGHQHSRLAYSRVGKLCSLPCHSYQCLTSTVPSFTASTAKHMCP